MIIAEWLHLEKNGETQTVEFDISKGFKQCLAFRSSPQAEKLRYMRLRFISYPVRKLPWMAIRVQVSIIGPLLF